MAKVMIKCPNTGKEVFTGMAFDAKSFETAMLIDNIAGSCPHCGQDHKWSKEDAYLKD